MNDLPALLRDDTWRRCLNGFIRAIGEQPGQIIATPKDARQILIRFFAGDDRLPGDYTSEEIAARLFAIDNPHTGERLSRNTRKKWEALLTAFYDFASTYTPEGEPLFQQPNPVRPGETQEQEEQEERQAIAVVEIAVDENWQSCLGDYLRSVFERSNSTKSLVRYTHELRVFFSGSANGGPPKHPQDYTRKDVEFFVHRLCQSRNSGGQPTASTRASRLAIIKSFYKFAENYTVEGPDGRPMRLLQTPPPTLGMYPPNRIHTYKGMSLDELKRFFAQIDTSTVMGARDFAIFVFFLYTLRRREEVARLRWGDIEQATINDGQGQAREGWIYHWSGKGDAGARHSIELPTACIEALERYLIVSGRIESIQPDSALWVGIGPGRGGGVGSRGDTPLDGNSLYWLFRKYAAQAGLDITRVSLHSLRHSGIQQRLLAGQEITAIMRVSGHKDLKVFMRYAATLNTADTGAALLEKRFDFLEGVT